MRTIPEFHKVSKLRRVRSVTARGWWRIREAAVDAGLETVALIPESPVTKDPKLAL